MVKGSTLTGSSAGRRSQSGEHNRMHAEDAVQLGSGQQGYEACAVHKRAGGKGAITTNKLVKSAKMCAEGER